MLDEVQRAMVARLEAISIEDLCREADAAGVGKSTPDAADFSI